MAFSLKRWVTGMLESTRLNDTNTNWTDIESAVNDLETITSLWQHRELSVPSIALSAGLTSVIVDIPSVDGYVPQFATLKRSNNNLSTMWAGSVVVDKLYAQAYTSSAKPCSAEFIVWYRNSTKTEET